MINEVGIIIGVIGGIIGLFAGIFSVYHFFRNPDIKADKEVSMLKNSCDIRSKRVDELIEHLAQHQEEVKEDIKHIKNNHLSHIEASIKNLEVTQAKILGQLESFSQIIDLTMKNNEQYKK